jgi:hypothetical protein
MALSVHNTTSWPAEKLLPYGADITKAMRKLVDRFPRDITVLHLAQEIIAGKKQLWLILEGEKFVSFVLTEIQINDATGLKNLLVVSLAGDEGAATVPLGIELEKWGIENGCTEARTLARKGWTRPLLAHGYKEHMVLFRKPIGGAV